MNVLLWLRRLRPERVMSYADGRFELTVEANATQWETIWASRFSVLHLKSAT
jgi:hypothetical protein